MAITTWEVSTESAEHFVNSVNGFRKQLMAKKESDEAKFANFSVAYSNCSLNLKLSDLHVKTLIEMFKPGQYLCGTGTLTVFPPTFVPKNYIRLHDVQSGPLGGLPKVGKLVAEMGK